jgi:hypothetical protein
VKKLQVGCTVWRLCPNRRVYSERVGGAPIFRGYFEPRVISGQTRLSWILDDGTKVPKRGADRNVYLSEKAVEDEIWIQMNRENIVDAIRRRASGIDADSLREVAKLLGVKETTEPAAPKRYRREGPCLIIG